MTNKSPAFLVAIALVIYLLVAGVGAAAVLIINFPTEVPNGNGNKITFPHKDENGSPNFIPFGKLASTDQGLLLLAALAGSAGSFLHAAQSLSTYIGNVDFKASWAAWYLLRPWIGGILGLAIYFALRSGLFSGAGTVNVNPYGVVALGLLGGWFSKTTTDKLQEVFETLFKTDEDKKRKDKLRPAGPILEKVEPSVVPSGANELIVIGRNFLKGVTVLVGEEELQPEVLSETKLKVSLGQLRNRPASGTEILVRVKNPEENEPPSRSSKVTFQ